MIPPLYKYVTSGGIDILINHRIKATPPNRFNDVFEFQPLFKGKPSHRMVKIHLRDKKAMREQYDNDKAIGLTNESYKSYKTRMRDVHRQIVPQVASLVAQKFDNNRHTLIDKLSNLIGVICFSSVPDSLLMWAHYAESHTGLVIEFDVQHPVFANTRRLEAVTYSRMRPIITLDGSSSITLQEDGWRTLLTKSIEWEYEAEWRTTTPLKATQQIDYTTHTEYFAPLPIKAIKSVILGARASEILQRKILDLVTAPDFCHIAVAKAQLHDREYRLQISKIK